MTTEEKKAEIGGVVLAHAEATKTLACIESKAARMAQDLRAVADQLTTSDRTEIVTAHDGGITIASPTEDLRRIAVPTRDEVQAVFRELAQARAELEELARRRAQMGID